MIDLGDDAVDRAKVLAKIDADEQVNLRRISAVDSPFEALEELFGVSGSALRGLAAMAWITGAPPRGGGDVRTGRDAPARTRRHGAGGARVD